jgi:hypothetical protein
MRTSHRARPALPLLLCAGLMLAPLPAPAADQTTFELTDGSVVTGELLGIDAGGYRVHSPTLGTLFIDQSDVRVMRRGAPAAPASASTGTDAANLADIEGMQRRLIADPDIMAMIMALRDDPALGAAIRDPALMQAITSGNLDAVRDNAQFLRLMEHPDIRAIIERMDGG